MNFRMLYDIIQLQNSVEAKDAKIAELTNDIDSLHDCWRQLHECLDEKNKDIASLHRQLREVEENLSKLVSYKAWNIAEDLEINIELSEG